MRSESEIKQIMEKVLSKCSADESQVEYSFEGNHATRFAENAITQNMGGREEELHLTVAFGSRHCGCSTNRVDEEALDDLVERSEEGAKAAPEDPEYVPMPEPQDYPEVPQRYYDDVAAAGPHQVAEGVKHTVEVARSKDYAASGLFETKWGISAVRNSKGLYGFDNYSAVDYSTTMHGPKGSGSAWANSESMADVSPSEEAQKALETAEAAQDPRQIEPGDYTVIFEPQAVFDLLEFMAWLDMDARDADEGTTVFADKVGEKIFSEKVNLSLEIDDPDLPAPPFGDDGVAARRTQWVEDGVLRRLRHDRYWAKEKGTDPDPLMFPMFMAGGSISVDEMIADCDKGLLVKRLWYIRYVDKKQLLLTGLTRDGLFLVENGEVTGPVQNLRFNESPLVFLSNVVALGEPRRVGPSAKIPAVMSENFTFSSKTTSV